MSPREVELLGIIQELKIENQTLKWTIEEREKQVQILRIAYGLEDHEKIICLTNHGDGVPALVIDGRGGQRSTISPTSRREIELEKKIDDLKDNHKKWVRAALLGIIEETSIDDWLNTPNPKFGDLSPNEMMEKGEFDKIWEMIYRIEHGVII